MDLSERWLYLSFVVQEIQVKTSCACAICVPMCHAFYRIIEFTSDGSPRISRIFGSDSCRGDIANSTQMRTSRPDVSVCVVIRAHYVHTRVCVGPPEWADEWVSTEEKVSHMGASVPCNTSPTDGGDIRAADVQMKLTDWLRLNRLHILLRLRRTTSGEPGERPGRGDLRAIKLFRRYMLEASASSSS